MEPKPGPLDQLDVPLVWDRKVPDGGVARVDVGTPPDTAGRWSRARLWTAALADLGVVLLSLSAALGVAASLGASLLPVQLAISGVAGVLIVGAIGVGSLWGWRATPGMVLLRLRFHAPMAIRRAHRVWFAWMCALAAAGVPLLFGRRGRTLAERLAGSEITIT